MNTQLQINKLIKEGNLLELQRIFNEGNEMDRSRLQSYESIHVALNNFLNNGMNITEGPNQLEIVKFLWNIAPGKRL
jgi:hypothetical protein